LPAAANGPADPSPFLHAWIFRISAGKKLGTDRVGDWLGQGRYRDPQEFVESIPFTETREYVQAILRNANVYRQLYGTP